MNTNTLVNSCPDDIKLSGFLSEQEMFTLRDFCSFTLADLLIGSICQDI